MEDALTPPATETEVKTAKRTPSGSSVLIAAGLTLVIFVWFYGFVPCFGANESLPLFGWLMGAWNGETGIEHGLSVVIMILGLLCYRFKDLRDAARAGQGSYLGLIAVFIGALLYVLSHRLVQPRFSAFGLPLLLWGACHFLWGWRVAKITFFPLIFYWLAIPAEHPSRNDSSPALGGLAGTPFQFPLRCGDQGDWDDDFPYRRG